MTELGQGTPDAYFETMWSQGDDPWDHGGRWYEERKRALTVAALPAPRYTRAFEPGCGAGFLTELLAPRVEQLIAMERSPRGAAATRRRCAAHQGVHVVTGAVPSAWPPGPFDLIVLAELLYYFADADLDEVIALSQGALAPSGHLVAVHFREQVPEHVRLGDEVHVRLRERLGAPCAHHEEERFLLEVFAR